MLVLRNQSKGAKFASFGFGLCIFAFLPNEVGYQDIASLLARQPGIAERWQKRVFAPALSSIQVATYSFGRPIGSGTPENATFRTANFDNDGIDLNAITRNPIVAPPPRYQASDFPKVDRTLKGDRLAIFNPADPVVTISPAPAAEDPSTSNALVMGAKTAERAPSVKPAPLDPELTAALNAGPLPQYDVSLSLEAQPLDELRGSVEPDTAERLRDPFAVKTSSLFFGNTSLGDSVGGMERWQDGEEPVVLFPDPDMKATGSLGTSAIEVVHGGESLAAKGEVNAENQRAKTPAERLGLFDDKSRAKSEKCLAEAVYFEARGEAVRGQIAVAQVVMNRVFSGYYPTTVCGVVYQNKHRHLACQFTFACDNVADVIREPEMWERAKKISKAMLDGLLWLPEVAKSTHYHAYWVHPSWVREMKKMYRFGVHTFYRPRAWGDGSDSPSWGTPQETASISAKLAEASHSSAETADASDRR